MVLDSEQVNEIRLLYYRDGISLKDVSDRLGFSYNWLLYKQRSRWSLEPEAVIKKYSLKGEEWVKVVKYRGESFRDYIYISNRFRLLDVKGGINSKWMVFEESSVVLKPRSRPGVYRTLESGKRFNIDLARLYASVFWGISPRDELRVLDYDRPFVRDNIVVSVPVSSKYDSISEVCRALRLRVSDFKVTNIYKGRELDSTLYVHPRGYIYNARGKMLVDINREVECYRYNSRLVRLSLKNRDGTRVEVNVLILMIEALLGVDTRDQDVRVMFKDFDQGVVLDNIIYRLEPKTTMTIAGGLAKGVEFLFSVKDVRMVREWAAGGLSQVKILEMLGRDISRHAVSNVIRGITYSMVRYGLDHWNRDML